MKLVTTVILVCLISNALSIPLDQISPFLSRRARYVTNARDQDNFDEQLEQYLITVKSKCDSVAGNEDAFNTLMEEFLKFLVCVTPLVDNFDVNTIINFHDDTDDFNRTAVKHLFETMCPIQQQAFLCVNNLTYTADICLESKERELKDNLVNYVKGLAGFLCKQNGEPVLKFLDDSGISCLNQTLPKLMQCRDRFNDIVESEDFLFTLDAAMCSEIKTEKECISNHLDECPQKTTKKLYNDYFNATWNTTSCRRHYTRS